MSKATARTHWVWTEKAASNWDNRFNGRKRIAGQPIKGETEKSKEAEAAWLLRGYVIDASDYIPADGQMDIFDFLEVEAGLTNLS
ncbi:hypothetical protein [Paenibacillus alvei]|uniref:hypothetical protein n=1 Tax=Paenibacillus alvei TaxID=44250 RepID=UPI0018CFD4F7|nr:hypothetical protein [Paenibacillus alvei]MBG9734565.1 hypothetical protein [Paenibacillus alvei]MBG9743124.1 hypothetical protein [Paenibacillus alvei]MCY9579573.1 hypothetical protein [Paenibacillus alvei]MCY9586533.1 hypothetical protein [Paenibacillus alvei]